MPNSGAKRLMKNSDQPSFCSYNFLPFTSADALRSSDISRVKPELNPNTRGGTANKIISSPYNKHFEATHKEKIKQATQFKTRWIASNALLDPSKRRKRKVFRDPTPSYTPSDSNTELAVPLSDDSTEDDEEQELIVCSVLVVSLKTTMEKSGYDERNILDCCEHCVLVWRKMLFVSLVRDMRCFFLSFIICNFNFF
jgi:hypothetical protein